jgi:hypothetical protein
MMERIVDDLLGIATRTDEVEAKGSLTLGFLRREASHRP